jgi:hypothetical protein
MQPQGLAPKSHANKTPDFCTSCPCLKKLPGKDIFHVLLLSHHQPNHQAQLLPCLHSHTFSVVCDNLIKCTKFIADYRNHGPGVILIIKEYHVLKCTKYTCLSPQSSEPHFFACRMQSRGRRVYSATRQCCDHLVHKFCRHSLQPGLHAGYFRRTFPFPHDGQRFRTIPL